MQYLTDYSGEFDPSIRYQDFSRDFLLKALAAYAGYIRRLDGHWYLTVKDRLNDDEAIACDRQVWADTMEIHDVETVCKLFKINGKDVGAFFKALQMSPWMWSVRYDMELKSPNRGIWTVTRCPMLLALEEEGEGRERRICCQNERELFEIRAHYINPKIKVIPLKLPPRQSPAEVHCQWEFRLEE